MCLIHWTLFLHLSSFISFYLYFLNQVNIVKLLWGWVMIRLQLEQQNKFLHFPIIEGRPSWWLSTELNDPWTQKFEVERKKIWWIRSGDYIFVFIRFKGIQVSEERKSAFINLFHLQKSPCSLSQLIHNKFSNEKNQQTYCFLLNLFL